MTCSFCLQTTSPQRFHLAEDVSPICWLSDRGWNILSALERGWVTPWEGSKPSIHLPCRGSKSRCFAWVRDLDVTFKLPMPWYSYRVTRTVSQSRDWLRVEWRGLNLWQGRNFCFAACFTRARSKRWTRRVFTEIRFVQYVLFNSFTVSDHCGIYYARILFNYRNSSLASLLYNCAFPCKCMLQMNHGSNNQKANSENENTVSFLPYSGKSQAPCLFNYKKWHGIQTFRSSQAQQTYDIYPNTWVT